MNPGSLSLDEAQRLFKEFLKKAELEFERKAKPPIPNLRISEVAPNLSRSDLGVVPGLGEIIIPTCELSMTKGILAMEAFKLLLPNSIAGLSQATNLAFAFAYQQLNVGGKERWREIWERIPGLGEKVNLGDLVFDPVESFMLLEHLRNNRGLGELMKVFTRLDRFHMRLNIEDFIRQVEDFISQSTVTLSSREIKILDSMLREGDLSAEELAKRTNLTTQVVSTAQTSLRRRAILFTLPRVNLSRLGYQSRFFYLSPELGVKAEVQEKLHRYKHLSSLVQFIDGVGGFMATFSLPSESKEKADLDLLEKELRPICLPEYFQQFRGIRRLHFVNFRSYSQKRGWQIKWRTWVLWLKRMLDEGLPEILPSREKVIVAQKAPSLDNTDQAILAEISRGEWRLRQLREKLRIGTNVLAAKMQRLRREKIIQDEVGFRFIGLEETAYLLFYGQVEETDLLIAGLNELPYHISTELEGDKEGLFTILYLPRGEVSTMARQLRKHLPKIKLEIRYGTQIPLSVRHFPPLEYLR